MKKVLVINSSAKTLRSLSRNLTEAFTDHWTRVHGNPTIRFRELGNVDVPHITDRWISAAFKPKETRSQEEIESLKTSDAYISELKEADVIVLGAPMYNWSIPSSLKAYIDQILRVNETFVIDSTNERNPYVGLLENKTLFLLLSRGEQGYEKGDHNELMNFQSSYLTTVFNIIGIINIHVVAISRKSIDLEKFKSSVDISHQTIRDLIEMELV